MRKAITQCCASHMPLTAFLRQARQTGYDAVELTLGDGDEELNERTVAEESKETEVEETSQWFPS